MKWKKKFGDVHLMDKNTTRCGIPMLGNNYADDNDKISCNKCTTFNTLDKINKDSVTSYDAALYKACVLELSNMSIKELEEFLKYEKKLCVD